MKKLFVALFAAVAMVSSVVAAGDGEWLTDMKKAQELSAKTGKPILADFSGSDWCGWCIKLDKEVFSQKEFKEFASKNLILVMVDFPRKKAQSEEVKKQNQELQSKYEIQGFPTVLLLDSKGEVIGRTGYVRGGATNYIANLEKMLKKK
ncbi:MAG: thioredoxin family protein [Victivallaceae bacterium]